MQPFFVPVRQPLGLHLVALLGLCAALGCGTDAPPPPSASTTPASGLNADGSARPNAQQSTDQSARADFSDNRAVPASLPLTDSSDLTAGTGQPGGQTGSEQGTLPDEVLKAASQRESQIAASFARLVQSTLENDPLVWNQADEELRQWGSAAAATVGRELNSPQQITRELAAMFLASLGPGASDAIPALRIALGDESPTVRVNVAAALCSFPAESDLARPVLEELLTQPDPVVQTVAVSSLGGLGATDPSVARPLVTLLEAGTTPDSLNPLTPDLELALLNALGQCGAAAEPALALLRERGQSDNPEVRTAAATALRRIDPALREESGTTLPASATAP